VFIYEMMTGKLPRCRCHNGKGNSRERKATLGLGSAVAASASVINAMNGPIVDNKIDSALPPSGVGIVDDPPNEWCTFGTSDADEHNAGKPDGRFVLNVAYDSALWSPNAIDLVQKVFSLTLL
jgi:hypothetical protein